MAKFHIMARFENAGRDENMSDTSAPKTFGNLENPLPSTEETADGKMLAMLAMFQATLAELNKLPALRAERVSLYDQGEQIAGIVIRGAHWDNAGNLAINNSSPVSHKTDVL